MYYDQDIIGYRMGVLSGAAEAVQNICLHLKPCDALAFDEWLVDLAEWTEGPMPPAPYKWDACEVTGQAGVPELTGIRRGLVGANGRKPRVSGSRRVRWWRAAMSRVGGRLDMALTGCAGVGRA